MVTGISSISSQVNMEIQGIEEMIDAIKKKEGKDTSKQVDDLLIEYIIANMMQDLEEMQGIQNQISTTINSYGNTIQNLNEVKSGVEAMKNNPSDQTESVATLLQNILEKLKSIFTQL